MENFGKIECNECSSKKLDVIELDEYNGIVRFKCESCGESFMQSINKL